MLTVFRNAWVDAQLRKKILYTLFILLLFRLGSCIFVPFLDNAAITEMISGASLLNYLDVMTGGALGRGTLLAMSITPYINASIIIQLLTVAIPPLERLSKEGEEGRKKINTITKFTALGIAIFQATAFYFSLRKGLNTDTSHTAILKYGDVLDTTSDTFSVVLAAITIIACFVAGASVIIWLGDRINEKGIGNGISMILFAGIVARLPETIGNFIGIIQSDPDNIGVNVVFIIATVIIFVAMIWFVIFMTNAERRIPVQYAKRVVGRKMYGGQSTHIPIKVAMSGVMPIIFAMSLMSLPQTICYFFGIDGTGDSFWDGFVKFFSQGSALYAVIYFVLIIAFNYFYVAITYNPVEIANNLKKNNGAIPGYRPGKPTSDFIYNSLNKITLIGAIFLGVIAIFPIVLSWINPSFSAVSLGGTTMLIIVGVALETVRTLESQIMMRHHPGFLD
ncbi:MAG: preprotein translocase subunit SecY [Lachnospiraceae bacterium]|nr:preprotein translocase subunit SecY [Ruminococcus sp.]MCM1275176.1 preprotein translocase subunit SecY [Lachnospiraceae bacterium]